MRNVIPRPVLARIADHLRAGCRRGEQGWEFAHDEEDTITGDLCSSLRVGWRRVSGVSDGYWRWRCTYTKFRGRGPGAEEHIIGADGIVQLEVENVKTGRIITKGLLFQAKKVDSVDPSDLLDQVGKMERLMANCSAVFEYG